MKKEGFNQIENTADYGLLLENLNFEQENLDEIVQKINIPYGYLDIDTRADINNIVDQFIKPNLQDALRAKEKPSIFTESIQKTIKMVTPEILSIDKFLHNQKEIYIKKINLQNIISNFLTENLEGKDNMLSKKADVVAKGINLYKQSLEIEPVFFGYNSQIKTFIDYYDNRFFEEYEKNQVIDNEERLLLLTPSQPSYFLQREVNFTEYKISAKENRSNIEKFLTKLYFNDDEAYFDNYFKNIISKDNDFFINDKRQQGKIQKNLLAVEEQFHNFFVKKQYFLLERKIKHARDVDELLIIDNCFDKYFESKLCFLHDLFLKSCLINWIDGNYDFHLDNSNVENSIKSAINFDDNQLLGCKNNKIL